MRSLSHSKLAYKKNIVWYVGPRKGFQSPGAKLQSEAPGVCDRSEQKGQNARESEGTETGGALRTLCTAPIGRPLEYILRGYK